VAGGQELTRTASVHGRARDLVTNLNHSHGEWSVNRNQSKMSRAVTKWRVLSCSPVRKVGWPTGLEPVTFGATILCFHVPVMLRVSHWVSQAGWITFWPSRVAPRLARASNPPGLFHRPGPPRGHRRLSPPGADTGPSRSSRWPSHRVEVGDAGLGYVIRSSLSTSSPLSQTPDRIEELLLDDMGVDPRREGRVGVAQLVRDEAHRRAFGEEQAGVAVAQVVEAHRR
jgi:hypothetical protein